MKVSLSKYYTDCTINEVKQMRKVIAFMKEDEESIKGYAEYAIKEAMNHNGYIVEIYKATAETSLNARAWNAYGEETGHADIMIEATAKTSEGFIEISAYLTDIWQSGAISYSNHMVINKYFRSEGRFGKVTF